MQRVAYNVADAAEQIGLGQTRFREEVLPHLAVVRMGRRILVPHAQLVAWVEKHAQPL